MRRNRENQRKQEMKRLAGLVGATADAMTAPTADGEAGIVASGGQSSACGSTGEWQSYGLLDFTPLGEPFLLS